jgi:hypothetical protein
MHDNKYGIWSVVGGEFVSFRQKERCIINARR